MTTTTKVTARRATKSTMMADDDMATGYDDVDGDGETGDGTAGYDDDDNDVDGDG
jgi:hypothetical protein